MVDGSSTDDTLRILEKNFYKLNALGINTLLLFGKTLGYARSLGVKHSTNEFILFIDADIILSKQYIDQLLLIMLSDKNVGISRGILLLSDNTKLLTILENISRYVGYIAYKRVSKVHVGGEGMLARRKAICDAGNFNPYMMTSEDEDLAMRISLKGWKIISTHMIFHEPAVKHISSLKSVFQWQFNNGFIASMCESLSHSKGLSVPKKTFKEQLEILALYVFTSLALAFSRKNPFYLVAVLYFLFKIAACALGRLKASFSRI